MNEQELVAAVRQTAGTDTVEHTEQAVRATLAVLGERLAGGEPGDLASQLPPALAEVIPSQGRGERFGLQEFYRRVADREGHGCSERDARRHARATMAAVKAAITPGEFEHLVAQLPDDYAELLGTEPVQHWARRTLRQVIDHRCGLIDPANPCRCGRQIASSQAAGILDRDRLPLARHARQEVRVWIEPVAKQLDAVVAIGDLYRYDRFAAPARLWEELQARFPDLLTSA